jgi:nucleoside-diphosphate-sugar epimerase
MQAAAPSSGPDTGKRLVVFGCGYVGAAVAAWAQGRGARVTALTRNPATAETLRATGIEVVVADLAAADWHGAIPGGADWVLNSVSSGGGGIEAYRRSYVDGTRSIVAWARAAGGVGTLVYTGSTSVYPQGDGVRVDESAPTDATAERPGLLLAAEAAVLGAAEVCRRTFVLRLAGIYGPGRHHVLDQLRSGAGEIAGAGSHRLNLVHRDDIVGAVAACFTAPPGVGGGIFNVADDAPAPKAEVVAWLAAQLGVAMPRFTGEPAGGRRAVTPDRIIVNRRCREVLGWRPAYPSYREGYATLLSH